MISKLKSRTNEVVEKKERKRTNKKLHKQLFIPEEKDTLFWIFYIMLYGHEDYNLLNNQKYTEEKKKKFRFIEEIKAKKSILKDYKIRKSEECIDELLNNQMISLKTFRVLCILYNQHFALLQERTIYIQDIEDCTDLNIIHEIEKGKKYGYESNIQPEIYENYKDTRLYIDDYTKPIRSMTYYKLDDLKIISERLCIALTDAKGKPKTKGKLYDEIYSLFI